MNTASSFPPLASPHGDGMSGEFVPEPGNGASSRLPVRLTLASAFRASYVELLSPATLLTVLGAELLLVKALSDLHPRGLGALTASWNIGLVCTFAFYAFVLALSTLSRLALRRNYDVEVSSDGLRNRSRLSRIGHVTRWRYFVWIAEVDGDIWLATVGQGYFIPRECFNSRIESRAFANRLRELRRTKGKVWSRLFAAE